jgi:hypothetical protein
VPRHLWPPPGATITRIEVTETAPAGTDPTYEIVHAERPAKMHLRALWWLLDEYTRGDLPGPGLPFEGRIVLEIARTEMRHGRIGHAYALNGGALGDPAADTPRGILWRWVEHHLRDA